MTALSRPVAILLAALLAQLTPGLALDWTKTGAYQRLSGPCRGAIEAGAVWWFVPADKGGWYLPSEHLWKPTFNYELKSICLACPALHLAGEMGLLPDRAPDGVPAEPPQREWREALRAAVRWAVENQNEDGGWGVGWAYRGIVHSGSQTSDTAAGIRLLLRIGGDSPEVLNAVKRAVVWLLDEQLEDGGWSRKKEESKEGSAWHTAAAVSALLEVLQRRSELGLPSDLVERVKRAVERGVEWLLRNQNEDGSWYSGLMCQEYSADTQAYVLSTLIDVYRLAGRLGLNVSEDRILKAIKLGLQWLFNSDKAGVTWVQTELGRGPAWAYSAAYLEAQGSPETTVTANVLRLAVLKAIWFNVGVDVPVKTPGGERRLADLITDSEYNVHATIAWLVSQQWREDALRLGHPEWYGGWPWPARNVTSTAEGASYEPASIWATSYAMRALEAYLRPDLYYGTNQPSRVETGAAEGAEAVESGSEKKVSGKVSKTAQRTEVSHKKRTAPAGGEKKPRKPKVIPVAPLVPPARRQRGDQ